MASSGLASRSPRSQPPETEINCLERRKRPFGSGRHFQRRGKALLGALGRAAAAARARVVRAGPAESENPHRPKAPPQRPKDGPTDLDGAFTAEQPQ